MKDSGEWLSRGDYLLRFPEYFEEHKQFLDPEEC